MTDNNLTPEPTAEKRARPCYVCALVVVAAMIGVMYLLALVTYGR